MHFDEVNVLFLVEKLQIKTWNKWRNIEYLREKTLKRIRKTIIRKLHWILWQLWVITQKYIQEIK